MSRRRSTRPRAAAGGLLHAALAAGIALQTAGALWQSSPYSASPRRRRPTGANPVPVAAEDREAAARACMKASVLLSRGARRSTDRGDEQALLAMSHLLETLHRHGIDALTTSPEAMLTALTRLVEHLERREREPRRHSNDADRGRTRP